MRTALKPPRWPSPGGPPSDPLSRRASRTIRRGSCCRGSHCFQSTSPKLARGKYERTRGQILGGVQDLSREEIARILRELVCVNVSQVIQVLRLDEEQQDAA